MDMDEKRKAGLNIKSLHEAMLETHRSIADLLRTMDMLLENREPAWVSNYETVTWHNSANLSSPAKWLPRKFARAWLRRDGDDPWRRALALYVQAFDETYEPWVACALLESLSEAGLDDSRPGQWWSWIWRLGHAEPFKFQWVPGMEHQAFAWSEPNDPSKLPVRACGYYLYLTDLQSPDDLNKLVIEPLLALHDDWDASFLPQPLPKWS